MRSGTSAAKLRASECDDRRRPPGHHLPCATSRRVSPAHLRRRGSQAPLIPKQQVTLCTCSEERGTQRASPRPGRRSVRARRTDARRGLPPLRRSRPAQLGRPDSRRHLSRSPGTRSTCSRARPRARSPGGGTRRAAPPRLRCRHARSGRPRGRRSGPGSSPPPVGFASPGSQPPSVRHSSRIAGPPARWMAPSTPPPPSSAGLAAFTIASTSCSVMSPMTSSITRRRAVGSTRG